MYTIDNLADQEYKIYAQDSLNNRTVVIFLSTLAICVGLCLVIIFALIRSRRRPTTVPALERGNTYVLQTNSPNPIEKELGNGFFSKVYLVKDSEKCPFALKTVDKPSNLIAEECIKNEIDILSRIKDNSNILKLIGSNMDEKIIILEYCFNGNLKEYVLKFKDLFVNELQSETAELDH